MIYHEVNGDLEECNMRGHRARREKDCHEAFDEDDDWELEICHNCGGKLIAPVSILKKHAP